MRKISRRNDFRPMRFDQYRQTLVLKPRRLQRRRQRILPRYLPRYRWRHFSPLKRQLRYRRQKSLRNHFRQRCTRYLFTRKLKRYHRLIPNRFDAHRPMDLQRTHLKFDGVYRHQVIGKSIRRHDRRLHIDPLDRVWAYLLVIKRKIS